MALSPKLSNEAASAALDAITALLAGGFMDVYDGVQPATVNTPITTQVKLATLTFGSPAFAAAVNGVAAANPITAEPDAPASGTIGWYRCYKADHVSAEHDGSAGASGCNANFGSATIAQHAVVTLDGFTLTQKKQL